MIYYDEISNKSYLMTSGNISSSTMNGTSIVMEKKEGMPVKIFFKLMKKKMGVLKDMSYKKRIAKIEKAVEQAEKNDQIAFSEELMKRLFVLCREAELWALGKKIFLEKEHFENFRHKTKRTVSLTKIENYARPIPKDVLKEKEKCDSNKIFDRYFIMHYDDKKTVKETEKEKIEREKDPILFGTIEYSDRLYYIADWEDEYCDLTLDDIVDKLELEDEDVTLSKSVKINDDKS